MIGIWNIEDENFIICNKQKKMNTGLIQILNEDSCRLPFTSDSISTFENDWKKAKGTWCYIRGQQDSICFEVPGNPYSGKYAIRFFTDGKGYSGTPNIYKIILENDSVCLICNKGGIVKPYSVKEWSEKISKISNTKKIAGIWNLEFSQSHYIRDSAILLYPMPLEIRDDGVVCFPYVYDTNTTLNELRFNSIGRWSVVSHVPDSIFIDLPHNPFHGKYAVRFYIDELGYYSMKTNYLMMELENDSTYILCNKAGGYTPNSLKKWGEWR